MGKIELSMEVLDGIVNSNFSLKNANAIDLAVAVSHLEITRLRLLGTLKKFRKEEGYGME